MPIPWIIGLLAKRKLGANEPVEPGDVPYTFKGEPEGFYKNPKDPRGELTRMPFNAQQNWASRLLGQENLGERANVAILSQLAQQRLLGPGALEQLGAEEEIKTKAEIGRKRKEAELEQEFSGKKAENAAALTLATRYGLSGDAAKELAPLLSAKAKAELAKESAVDIGARQKAEIETERAAKTRGTELGTAETSAKLNAEIANRLLQFQTDPAMQDILRAGLVGETLTPAARVVSGLDVGIGPGQVFQRPSIPGISRVIPGGAGQGMFESTQMREFDIGGKKMQLPVEAKTPGFYRPNLTYSPEEIQQILSEMAAPAPTVGAPTMPAVTPRPIREKPSVQTILPRQDITTRPPSGEAPDVSNIFSEEMQDIARREATKRFYQNLQKRIRDIFTSPGTTFRLD